LSEKGLSITNLVKRLLYRRPPRIIKPVSINISYNRLRKQTRRFERQRKLTLSLHFIKESIARANVLDSYPLNAPYAHVRIVRDKLRGNISYVVGEPELESADFLLLKKLKDLLMRALDVNIRHIESKEAAKEYLQRKCAEILKRNNLNVGKPTKEKLMYYIVRDHVGYGKIDPLMHDPLIEDISCDGENINIFVWHREFESIPTNIVFETSDELDSFALRLAYLCGRHVSIAQPMLDSSLPDGSRIHLTYGTEITRRGSTFSIRKFRIDPLTIIDMINFETISPRMAAYFWFAVENRVSILVSGGIAAGKTTLLNCLSMFIKPDLKIVSIEDTPELNLPHDNWIPSITRTHFGLGTEAADITLFDLLQASLRQRPEYIIVGEIRGGEAYTLFQAISTGHLGMSTIHAESVGSVVYRLESEPMNIPRTLISGIDIITIQQRVPTRSGTIRKTIVTSEIVGLDPRSGEILTNEIYRWNSVGETFDFTGRSYLVEKIAKRKGISVDEANEEIKRRTIILEWMSKRNTRNYREVSAMIRRYYENPQSVYMEVMMSE